MERNSNGGCARTASQQQDVSPAKTFGQTPARDKITLIDLTSGDEIKLGKGLEIGKYFLGLDLSAFKRTNYIQQLGAISSEPTGDDIAEKLLLNLVKGEEEESSQQEVLARLLSAKHGLVSKSGTKGLLVDKRKELLELKEEQAEISFQLGQQSELQKEYTKLRGYQLEIEALQQKLEAHKQLQNKEKLIKLSDLLTEGEILEQQLFSQQLTRENFISYIEEISALRLEAEQAKSSIAAMGTTEGIAQLTIAEIETHTQLVNSIARIQLLTDNQWQTVSVLMARIERNNNNLSSLNNNYDIEAEQYKRLLAHKTEKEKTEAEINGLQAKKQLLEEEQQHLANDIAREEEILQREKEIAGNKQRLSASQLGAYINAAIAMLVVFVSVMGVLYYKQYLVIVGTAILLGAVGFLLMNRITANKRKAHNAAEHLYSEYDERILEMQVQLDDTETNLSGVVEQLNKVTKESASQLFNAAEFERLQGSLAAAKAEAANLELESKTIAETLAQQTSSLEAELAKLGISYIEQDDLPAILSSQQEELAIFLAAKGFKTHEEFNKAVVLQTAQAENKDKLEQLDKKYANLEKTYIEKVSIYKPVSSFNEAKAMLSNLKLEYNEYIRINNEVEIIARTMGISTVDHDDINATIAGIGQLAAELSPEEAEQAKTRVEDIKAKDIIQRMEQLRINLRPVRIQPEQFALEIAELKSQVTEAEDYYSTVSLAYEVMQQSDEELRESFGPTLNKRAGEILASLTDGKYSELLINKDYEIRVKSGVHFREWQYLSSGTIDQAYLALRLAIAELIADEGFKMPLFLDDTLLAYDDNRARLAINFLKNYAEQQNTQLVMFSCHSRLAEYTSEIGVKTDVL